MHPSTGCKYKLATRGGYKRHVEDNFTEDKNNVVGTVDKLFASNNHQTEIENKSFTESKLINKNGSTCCL
jgi:hypothetical protein